MSDPTSIASRDGAITGKHLIIVELVGPLFLGIIANYFLWGVQTTQSYYYYKSYRNTDKKWLKGAVILLFVTDLIETICATQACWNFLVDAWGNLDRVITFPGWGFYGTPLVDSFTASIVHCFYAQKIWILLDAPYNRICVVFVIVLSGVQLTGGVGGSVFMYATHMTLLEFPRFKIWGLIWLITAALTDIVVTTIMTWRLSSIRTGFKATDDVISKLIRLTIETGLATAVVQLLNIIVILIWPLKSYHTVFAVIAPKLYSNSMLALLNSRQRYSTTEVLWHSHKSSPINSIRIRTSQTVSVVDDCEPNDNVRVIAHKTRSANDTRVAPDVETCSSLPVTTKGQGFTMIEMEQTKR